MEDRWKADLPGRHVGDSDLDGAADSRGGGVDALDQDGGKEATRAGSGGSKWVIIVSNILMISGKRGTG